jgi:TP901 family phage tail tape measure protein
MAIRLADAVIMLSADDSGLKKDLDKTEGTAKGWAGGMAGTMAKVVGGAVIGGVAAAGAAIVGLAKTGIESFAGFQGQMNEVFTLMPGISKDSMGKMNEQVKDFAKQFGVLPEEVVPALYQAISAGVPADNVFDFLATAQQAAVGGVTDLTTSVDGITSTVNAYGSEVMDATKASDLMFTAVKLGKTDFSQLSASLFNVIPTAASLGVGFEDITAAMAVMTAQGTPTSVATTQMRQLLVELSKDGGKAAQAFEDLAGKSFVQFVEEGGNVQGALAVMEEAAAKNNVRLSDMFGSVEAGNAAMALTGNGAEMFNNALAEMSNSAGATETAFKTMDSGITAASDKMKARWAVAMVDIGQSLAPLVDAVLPTLTEWLIVAIDWLTSFFKQLGTLAQYFTATVQEGDHLNDYLASLPGWLRPVIEFFGKLVALIQGDVAGSMDLASSKFGFIGERVGEIMPYIQQIVDSTLSAITGFWNSYGAQIMAYATTAFETVTMVIGTALDQMLLAIKLFLQIMTGDWEGAGQTIVSMVRNTWTVISTVIRNTLGGITGIVTSIDWGGMGRAIIEGIATGIRNGASAIANAARSAAQSAYDAAKAWLGISSPSKLTEQKIGAPFVEGIAAGIRKNMGSIATDVNLGLGNLMGGIAAPQGAGQGSGAGAIHVTVQMQHGDYDGAYRGAGEGIKTALRARGL